MMVEKIRSVVGLDGVFNTTITLVKETEPCGFVSYRIYTVNDYNPERVHVYRSRSLDDAETWLGWTLEDWVALGCELKEVSL